MKGFTLDYDRALIHVDGKEITAPPKEMEILKNLMDAEGRIVDRATLLDEVWGHASALNIQTRTVDQHIARLRRRLGPKIASRIVTVNCRGYRYKKP